MTSWSDVTKCNSLLQHHEQIRNRKNRCVTESCGWFLCSSRELSLDASKKSSFDFAELAQVTPFTSPNASRNFPTIEWTEDDNDEDDDINDCIIYPSGSQPSDSDDEEESCTNFRPQSSILTPIELSRSKSSRKRGLSSLNCQQPEQVMYEHCSNYSNTSTKKLSKGDPNAQSWGHFFSPESDCYNLIPSKSYRNYSDATQEKENGFGAIGGIPRAKKARIILQPRITQFR